MGWRENMADLLPKPHVKTAEATLDFIEGVLGKERRDTLKGGQKLSITELERVQLAARTQEIELDLRGLDLDSTYVRGKPQPPYPNGVVPHHDSGEPESSGSGRRPSGAVAR